MRALRLLTSTLVAALLAAVPALGADDGSEAQASEAQAAAVDCAERVARRVQAHYESVRDLSARFEQRVQSVMGGPGAETRSSGRVVFRKPGKMRWSYEQPQPSEVISDGSTLWLYDPAAGEVQKLAVAQGYLAGAGLQFLMGEGKLVEDFEVSADDCSAEATSVWLELVPREPASFERIRLRAEVESGEVRETAIVDLFGNETRIAFDALRLDSNPPLQTFQFEVPDGVEVIELSVPD